MKAGTMLLLQRLARSRLSISIYHMYKYLWNEEGKQGFPDGTVVKNLPANAGDTGSSPGLGRSHMPRSN